jgi:hypothetical protein
MGRSYVWRLSDLDVVPPNSSYRKPVTRTQQGSAVLIARQRGVASTRIGHLESVEEELMGSKKARAFSCRKSKRSSPARLHEKLTR